ncbi:MAG: ATP-dependent DNA helicase RecG [Patescibacteria group bacterium]
MDLNSPVSEVPRIGTEYQKKLKKIGIKTIHDLFWHFPHRYEDFSDITAISEIKIGQNVCIQGKITEMKLAQTWQRKMIIITALVQDKTGSMKVVWFNQPYIMNTLKEEDVVCLAGKITQGKKGIYLSSPTHEKISEEKTIKSNLIHTGRIIPVYHETEGVSSKWLRFILKPLMNNLVKNIQDPLPEEIRKKNKLLDIQASLWQIHFPDSLDKAEGAMKRFSFEQLFLLSLAVLKEKMRLLNQGAISIPTNLKIIQDFVSSLPFTLTNAQKKSIWRIIKDLEKSKPMNRLLEGDVGSGKTVVAVMATLNVAQSGYQTAIMAPTEILVNQHFKEIIKLLKNFKLKIGLLTGKTSQLNNKKITRKSLLEKISKGEIDILIGTHALIQKTVKFKNLALVILDEQHRFGVEQRAKLCQNSNLEKDLIPHLLSMTATPIPRTLALTLYGDLDLSLIDEMPKGRIEVITNIVTPKKRETAYQFIAKEIESGRQAFVICPRIESKSETEETISSWSETKTVKEEYKKLSENIFPQFEIDILHGKMKSEEKEEKMNKFKKGKTDILVSTSVVEVGIDCPNATVIMIEGAEKFGLAQLHQFRGRVGRGEYQSYCFLLTTSASQSSNQRLKALKSSQNGFQLAEKDLEIRGPGDLSGIRQWGIPDLAMNALKDIKLVETTREQAKQLLSEDPNLKKQPLLKEALKKYKKTIHLE